jgi:hypothetical protein
MAGLSGATVVARLGCAGLLIWAAVGIAGCGSSGDPPGVTRRNAGEAWFEDVTAASGLTFVHDAGPVGKYWMPQAIGSGAALFDFDNDGWLDIYLLQNGGPSPKSLNRLFRNTGPGPLGFTDVTASSGLGVAGQGMGVAAGDANNDGWVDVVVTEYGKLRFFTNQRDGTFRETTESSGLVSPLWGCSASFLDYDRDGWLDLVVANYVAYDPSRPCISAGGAEDFCAPKEFEGTVTKLFRNRGRTPATADEDSSKTPASSPQPLASSPQPPASFTDVTLAAGLGQTPGPGLGVLCADFSGDGWVDIFVANDGQPNRLWINRRDGKFSEEAVARGVAYNSQGVAEASMGVALADVDGQGGADLFVTHLTEERHTLWRQSAGGTFTDRTAGSRIARAGSRGTGFGTVMADFDLDGDVDLAIVNGRVSRKVTVKAEPSGEPPNPRAPAPFWRPYAERNQLFENDGVGVFEDVSGRNSAPAPNPESPSEAGTGQGFCAAAGVSRGLACGDLDNDGDLDLLVTSVGGKARIFRNRAERKGHWLLVRAVDARALGHGRDAYGAEVTLHSGDRRWWRQINPGYSFLCSNDPRAQFGVGGATAFDRIEVVWPDGSSEKFPGAAVDRIVELRKGEGKAVSP